MRFAWLAFLFLAALGFARAEELAPPKDPPSKETPNTIEAKPTAALDEKAVAAELDQLGHEDFATRERATENLIRRGAPVRALLEKREAASTDPEVKERCKRISAALGNPNATGVQVLKAIEESKDVFVRPGGRVLGGTFDGPTFANHLRTKASLQQVLVTIPAREFVEKVATQSSLHNSAYSVRMEDGTEMLLKDWLEKKIKFPPQEKKSGSETKDEK